MKHSRSRSSAMLLAQIVGLFAAVGTSAAEPVVVTFHDGSRVTAEVDPRTDETRLWLRIGSDRLRITRSARWDTVHTVRGQGRELSISEVREIARATPAPTQNVTNRISLPARSLPPANGFVYRPLPTVSRRHQVQTIRFDVSLSNWDSDVEMDGLVLELTPLTYSGELPPVQGMLHVQLWSQRRVDQDASPRSGGRSVEVLGRWAKPLRMDPQSDPVQWIQLPFQSRHPEFDTDWSSMGLVHVKLVLPGHGVFHHSEDGLRIRPFAPMRDALELQTGDRFFPGELTQRE